jgi:hypothetical protein
LQGTDGHEGNGDSCENGFHNCSFYFKTSEGSVRKKTGPARGQAAIRGGGVSGSANRASARKPEDFQEMVWNSGWGMRTFEKSAINGMVAVATGQDRHPQEAGGKVSV